jgi:hypothetical protein
LRGLISEMDVALARAGRTRDLWARTYLELDLLPQHRQTVDIRSKLFDHVCSHRKSVPAGLGDDVFFLDRVSPSVAIDDPYQSLALAAGRTVVGGIYVREAFVAEIPVVSRTHYEALAAWTRPGLDSQKFGISAAEQIELDTALKAYPGWVLQGYGTKDRAYSAGVPGAPLASFVEQTTVAAH